MKTATLPLESEVASPISTEGVRARLRRKFCAPEYGLLEEVRNGTGWSSNTRSADCLVMSLWPSRGLTLHGIEIKVNRSDWLRELKNPAKAEEIAAYCDHWWVAVGDREIIKDGELPPPWGLLVPRGEEMFAWKQPAKLESTPVDRLFLAAMFRRAAESSTSALEIKAACDDAVSVAKKEFAKNSEWRLKSAEESYSRLEAAVAAFKEKSGVDFSIYNAGRIGDAVRFVLAGGVSHAEQRLLDILGEVEQLQTTLKANIGSLQLTKDVST